MNLTAVNNVVTMSSLEIAELTKKEHRNVTVDIEKMLNELELSTAEFSAVYKAGNGQEYKCYNLPKRETLILVSGYNIELRSRIIDRWQELEQQVTRASLPDFTNPVIAARAWADEVEGRLIAEKNLEEAQPAIGFYDAVGDSTSLTSVGDAAKSLGFGRNHFFKWLRSKEFLMKDYNTPYQKWIEAKYFQVKYQSYVDEFGEVKHRPVTFITGKGLQYLQKQLD